MLEASPQPVPEDLRDAVRIFWSVSHWCNYQCPYCGVPIFNRRSREQAPQMHAFDHQPVSRWVEALDRFPQPRIALSISGGEPFLDRANFVPLLEALSLRPRFKTLIYTNGSWATEPYAHIDKSRMFLLVSFHPSQTPLDAFRGRLSRIREAGFARLKVHVILAPENLAAAEAAVDALSSDGVLVNVTAMQPAGVHLDRHGFSKEGLALLERHDTPYDAYFNVARPNTRGRMCLHPALAYSIEPNGDISVSCLDTKGNLFVGSIPVRPPNAVPCPWDRCFACPDMIHSLTPPPVPSGRPLTLFAGDEVIEEFAEYRRAQQSTPDLFRRTLQAATDAWTGESAWDRYLRMASQFRPPPEPFDVPTDFIRHAVPPVPVFGYIDRHTGSDTIETRAAERLLFSGWAASTRRDIPVIEVRLRAGDTTLAVFRDFYPRPEVAATFDRPDFTMTGWRGYCFLPPRLRPGDYPLVATAVDSAGAAFDLPPLALRVTA